MTVDFAQVSTFLKNVHLFNNLNDGQIAELIRHSSELTLASSSVLFREGDDADSFFLILEGKIQLVRMIAGKTSRTAQLVEGDYFGQEALAGKTTRTETASAVSDCLILRVSYSQIKALFQQTPGLKANLQAAESTRQLTRKKDWNWINPDEIIYALVREHPYYLYSKLTLPMIAFAAGFFAFIYLLFYFDPTKGSSFALIFGGLWLLAVLLWVGWDIWDWSNDYYFVTNQRVVWLEKVAGIYDSRQEAPLSTILSVGVESDQIGRMIGFGDVVVRTYTGSIPLRRVNHPNIIAAIIEEQLRRSQISLHKEEASEMENAIRIKLGLATPADGQDTEADSVAFENSIHQTVTPGFLKRLFGYLFQVRFDTGEVVTYRKHWFVLLSATWKQTVLFVLIAAGLLTNAMGLTAWIKSEGILVLLGIVLFVIFFWWLYDVIDWHNDIYQVSADQIIDINRKPFGTETKKTAPLENILSIEYERKGILGVVFNYGTVKIKVGNSSFDFDYVFDPSTVQHDIFRRKLEKEAKRKRAEREAERERLSSWIATYHQYNGEITGDGQPRIKPPIQGSTGGASQEIQGPDVDEEDRDGFGWIN